MLGNDSDEIKYYSEFWNEQGYVMKYGLIKSSYWHIRFTICYCYSCSLSCMHNLIMLPMFLDPIKPSQGCSNLKIAPLSCLKTSQYLFWWYGEMYFFKHGKEFNFC